MKKMGRYLREILGKYTKTVVWGTGVFYTRYRELLACQFAYFVDNDEKKWGCFLDRKEICPPEKLAEEDDKNTLVIVCNHYFEEISNQIKQYGKFSLIDIVTMGLLHGKERNVTEQKPMKADRLVAVSNLYNKIYIPHNNPIKKPTTAQAAIGSISFPCFPAISFRFPAAIFN